MNYYQKILVLAITIMLSILTACDTERKPQPPSPMLAAVTDNPKMLSSFIEDGLDINGKNRYGQTLLHIAAMEGSINVARLLVSKGANIESKDTSGDTPIYHAAGTGRERIVVLLIESGANLNVIGKYGNCPLSVALGEKNTKIAETLRAAGAKECMKAN